MCQSSVVVVCVRMSTMFMYTKTDLARFVYCGSAGTRAETEAGTEAEPEAQETTKSFFTEMVFTGLLVFSTKIRIYQSDTCSLFALMCLCCLFKM